MNSTNDVGFILLISLQNQHLGTEHASIIEALKLHRRQSAMQQRDTSCSSDHLTRLYGFKITGDKIKEVKCIKSSMNQNPCGVTSGAPYLGHISRNWLRSQQRVWNNDKWCHKLPSLSPFTPLPALHTSLCKAQLIHIGVTMGDRLLRYFV